MYFALHFSTVMNFSIQLQPLKSFSHIFLHIIKSYYMHKDYATFLCQYYNKFGSIFSPIH